MAGSQREVTARWSGQLSMKDDFLVLWSAGRVMRVRWGGFLGQLKGGGVGRSVMGEGRSQPPGCFLLTGA